LKKVFVETVVARVCVLGADLMDTVDSTAWGRPVAQRRAGMRSTVKLVDDDDSGRLVAGARLLVIILVDGVCRSDCSH